MESDTMRRQEVEEFVAGIIRAAAADRLPELFAAPHPDALYYVPDRNGLGVVVLPTPALSEEQITKLLRYRLAQYLAVGFLDTEHIYEARMEHEPRANVAPADIHYIAGNADTGELVCYAALWALPATLPGMTLRTRDRPLFPVEEVYGWGVFNRLRLLPDLPIDRIREVGRLMKNQQLPAFDELSKRAAVEICLALFRTFIGPLRMEVDAFIGDFEEDVAKKNMDFFYAPTASIHGVLPYVPEDDYNWPHLQNYDRYPFAMLVSDLGLPMRSRLPAVEQALEQPGKQGLLALFALKDDIPPLTSSLDPGPELEPLAGVTLPQRGVAMPVRRQMLDLGGQLRQFDLFSGLSVAEAATLGTFMERLEVPAGAVVVRQGDPSDALYLVEVGEADARVRGADGTLVVGTFGPGEYFGEIGLLTGGERTADVVALTPLRLLRLTRDTYVRYLSHMVDMERQMARTAATRLAERLRRTT